MSITTKALAQILKAAETYTGWDDSDMEEAMKAARAALAQEKDAPEPADLSHLSDEEFNALCPQGYHATGDCVSGPTDDELNVLWNRCGVADEYGHHEGNIFQYARAVLQYWGSSAVKPTPSDNPWRDAIDDALVCRFLLTEELEADPRKALNAIIEWEVAVSKDPRVSSDALPKPVPISERLPRAEDCAPWPDEPDATWWCWLTREDADCEAWEWSQVSALEVDRQSLMGFIGGGGWLYWLPYWALPLPASEA